MLLTPYLQECIMTSNKNPPLIIRLQVLAAIDYAPGATLRARIKNLSNQTFIDKENDVHYRFTWRTISTWFYRYKKKGITRLEPKTRSDKQRQRKVQLAQLAEALNDALPKLGKNKVGKTPKIALYRYLLAHNYFTRQQLARTTFYRLVNHNHLLEQETNDKLRMAFAMLHANELWQGDTLHGPSLREANGKWRKTFFIAFIDDASRLITHGEFFYQDNTENMIDAFRSALYKRGKPERLYFDNGSNYRSTAILQACMRLGIQLSHAPVRDGAAKGKIERFFRGFRDRFLVMHPQFESLTQLNDLAQDWIENQYNSQYHSGIQMVPLQRFNLDHARIQYLAQDEFTEEVFYVEENRKVSKVNIFAINSESWECPVDLRGKTIQIRYDPQRRDRYIVYFNGQRYGLGNRVNLYINAHQSRRKSL
jgi:transposase InsO family protein